MEKLPCKHMDGLIDKGMEKIPAAVQNSASRGSRGNNTNCASPKAIEHA